MEDKKIKIRELFASLNPERKNNVRSTISKKFKISVDSAKMNWIYGGKIPAEHVEAVQKIIVKELQAQSDDILQLIDAI